MLCCCQPLLRNTVSTTPKVASCILLAPHQHHVIACRGCGGLKLTSPRIYSAVHTDDVHLTMVHLHARYPRARVAAVGYSLGSMILTKYVAEADSGHWPGGSLLCAAAMISNPFNLRPLDAWELDAAQLQPGERHCFKRSCTSVHLMQMSFSGSRTSILQRKFCPVPFNCPHAGQRLAFVSECSPSSAD